MATILVLEDDRVVREVLVRILRQAEYEVLAFEDARPALETVDFSGIDLVVTDFQMPMRADEFVRALRTHGIQVPVMVVSGALSRQAVETLRGLGVQRFMGKPFRLQEFLDTVEEMIC